ncbi:hypothetical protein SAMN05216304_104120 [Bosea sp. OK403]|uniref:hypothetical protein n=1 Tax=Bosea sp. OK403 TaxID=1855286 RepID=UPI0008ED5EE0|nr:hypothetical protein [Bosea sp. OK403]SFJ01136.1 hypothetical protein SAMN05216304_104120 [Bosea sp. OK403]
MTTNGPGMGWRGAGFLVIANSVEPAALAEYEAWHSFEHVPERLTMPGFLGGRRFVRGRGQERRFLTLYDLDSPDALETPEYRHLLANPTPASRLMRPLMGDFRRFVYRERAHFGTGCGSHLGFLRWAAPEDGIQDDIAALSALIGQSGIAALRIGGSQETAPHPAFAPDPAASVRHAAAIMSGTDGAKLTTALKSIANRLSGPVLERSVYNLILAY